ncbi:MAG: hypothetical protein QOF02_846 [Blastocatellia bacterium]|jgi:ketosteroid isomerase-like protein|nr:hypothetical protein [Blastocatellia bacterium]
MQRKLVALAVALLAASSLLLKQPAQAQQKVSSRDAKIMAAVRAVLDAQTAAWNRGDIDGFMAGYARSDKTTFVSGDTLTRGWQTVLDRYKKGYDSREKMGQLVFSDLEIEVLDSNTALAVGRWQLTRANDKPHGRFSLTFRRTKEGWRIIHDHTSSAA